MKKGGGALAVVVCGGLCLLLLPVALIATVVGVTQTQCHLGGGSVQPGTYVDPLGQGQWAPARTDQGVDFLPVVNSPVLALGNGVVTYSSMQSGWPGGAFVAYELTDGPAAGNFVYVAEHLDAVPPVGTVLSAGQVVATGLPGYPWIETGWAAPDGPTPAVPYAGAADGTATEGGKMFARFLSVLGVRVADDPGPGPLWPTGPPGRITIGHCPLTLGPPPPITPGSGLVPPNAQPAYATIIALGGNAAQAAGWIGNFAQESDDNPEELVAGCIGVPCFNPPSYGVSSAGASPVGQLVTGALAADLQLQITLVYVTGGLAMTDSTDPGLAASTFAANWERCGNCQTAHRIAVAQAVYDAAFAGRW